MHRHTVHTSIVDAVLLPHLVRLESNVCGAAFFLMKLLPAAFILENARESGVLQRGSTVIETTSGTFGLALALLCQQAGYRLILVSDPAIDAPLQRRLEELGAVVDIVREPAAVGGFQRARLDRMAQHQVANPDHFWPAQYDNVHNPGGYGPLAALLIEALGRVDCLVGTVGSGGSVCGTAGYLRRVFPGLCVVGVDTHGSVLFGQPDGRRLLRGLGNSLMPKNVQHGVFDEVHWVAADEGFCATRELHRRHGLFMGPTSGAAYLVARWWAREHPNAQVVALLPDEGYRYQETVYDDAWLRANGVYLDRLPDAPQVVTHPCDAGPRWARLVWGQRGYAEVVGQPLGGVV